MMLGVDVEMEMLEASRAEKKTEVKQVGDVRCDQSTRTVLSNDHGLLKLGYHVERCIGDIWLTISTRSLSGS